MDIVVDEAKRAEILAKIRERKHELPKGMHLTDLLLCLNKPYLRELHGDVLDDSLVLLFTAGHAMQAWITGSYEPEESFMVDGVWMTPDWTRNYWCPNCKESYESH